MPPLTGKARSERAFAGRADWQWQRDLAAQAEWITECPPKLSRLYIWRIWYYLTWLRDQGGSTAMQKDEAAAAIPFPIDSYANVRRACDTWGLISRTSYAVDDTSGGSPTGKRFGGTLTVAEVTPEVWQREYYAIVFRKRYEARSARERTAKAARARLLRRVQQDAARVGTRQDIEIVRRLNRLDAAEGGVSIPKVADELTDEEIAAWLA